MGTISQQLKVKISRLRGFQAIVTILDRLRAIIYDWSHHVETRKHVRLRELTVVGNNALVGNNYQATPPKTTRTLLRDLPIRYSDFTFVDFGSGKGAVILVAAEFPFRRVIGIEFALELHEIAQRNIVQYTGRRRSPEVVSIHCDAIQFKFPLDPLVLYFFNPFRRAVMAQVVGNLLMSLQSTPREVFLLFQRPHYPKDLVVGIEGVERFKCSPYFDIYRISP